MYRFRVGLVQLLLVSLFLSLVLLPTSNTVNAQDLVATDGLSGGSSVFVFRESRKKPQTKKAIGGSVTLGAGGRAGAGGSRASRSNAEIAAAAKKRRAAAIAARKKAAAAAKERKIVLSNTLATKAEGFLDADQIDPAITNFRASLVQNPKNARAAEGLSNALTAKGIDVAGEANSQAAIVHFDEAVKYDPKNDVAYAKLGAIYDTAGKSGLAASNYEKALALNPAYTQLYGPLGMSYIQAGEIAKADAVLTKAEAAGANDAEARMLRGLLLLKQNKNDEALAAFDKVLAANPRLATAQYYRGQAFDRLNKQDESVAAYKEAIAIDPAYSAAWFDLGVTYYNKGDYANAVTAYQNTLKYDPNNAQAHANLASTYRQMDRFGEANAEYKAASTEIKNVDLYSEWGYSLGQTKEWDKSVDRLNTAKEMSPTAIENNNVGWAQYNDASAKKEAKDEAGAKKSYADAKVSLETAKKQDPKLDAAYVNLGSTHNALGEYQLAVDVLQIAVGLRPNWPIAMNQLGCGYRGLNNLVQAVAIFKQVVNLDGNSKFGLFNLGEAYYASGNKKEAKKVNDKLKKLDPTMATLLDNVIAGRVINAATQQVTNKIPKPPVPVKVPRLPF